MLAAIAASAATLLLSRSTSLLNGWDDWRWKILSEGHGSIIYFVDIDENSLSRYGRWPWPRERLAALLENLLDIHGAGVVGVDVILSERGDSAGNRLLASLDQERIIWAHAASMGEEPAVNRGVLGAAPRCPPGAPWPSEVQGWLGLTEEIARGNFRGGHIRPWFDGDQVVRTYQPFLPAGNSCIPALGLAMYGVVMGLSADTAIAADGKGWHWGGIPLGLEKSGLLRLVWRTSSIQAISAEAVLEGQASIPAGALIVVGSTAVGIGDFVATPVSNRFTGAGIHALALRQWLDRNFVIKPAFHDLLLGCLLAPLFIAFWIFSTQAAIKPWLLWGGVTAVWTGLSSALWIKGIMLESEPLLWALLWLPAIQGLRLWQEKKTSRLIYKQFHAYLPEKVLQQLINSRVDPLQLQAEAREITVLFADLRGFTTLSENMTPETVVSLLNEVMEYLSGHIADFDGTLDKFMGDGAMAFWGSPVPMDDHGDRAVSCAIAMLEHLDSLNERLMQKSMPPVQLGIGINSGPVAVGHMGSRNRKNYTAVGDTVNIASRLQELSRDMGHPLLIGAETARICHRSLERLEDIDLKGKKKRVTVYIPKRPCEKESAGHSREEASQKNGA